MDPNYHAGLDNSDFLNCEDIAKYRMMVGSFNWLVTLGCYNIHHTTCTLAYYMMIPKEGHMHAMCCVFGYLHQNYKFSIKYDMNKLNFTKYKILKYDWFVHYGMTKEEKPFSAPEIKGKRVITWEFFDALHASFLVTR